MEQNAATAQSWIRAWKATLGANSTTATTTTTPLDAAPAAPVDARLQELGPEGVGVGGYTTGKQSAPVDARLRELGPEGVEQARKWIANWKEEGMPTEASKAEEAKGWIESWKVMFKS